MAQGMTSRLRLELHTGPPALTSLKETTMPDLESHIADWRRQMDESGVHSADVLEELECHLRDDCEVQSAAGASAAEAFESSVARLGSPDLLKKEFDKVGDAGRRHVKSVFLTLAGIPQTHYPSTMNMTNTPINAEPRWASYTKAAVFLAPAVVLWIFSVIYLMPKLRQICREAGVTLPWVYQVTDFFADHALLVTIIAMLPFALLEWRWERWPQFRRVSLGGAVFLINATVLALITLMVIFALFAAPQLMSKV
jgi:hypothetical protein